MYENTYTITMVYKILYISISILCTFYSWGGNYMGHRMIAQTRQSFTTRNDEE
jgi:hypothetical protein